MVLALCSRRSWFESVRWVADRDNFVTGRYQGYNLEMFLGDIRCHLFWSLSNILLVDQARAHVSEYCLYAHICHRDLL